MKKCICNIISVKSEEDFNKVKMNYQHKQKILIHCQECKIPIVKYLGRVISTPFEKLYCRKCSIVNSTFEKYGVINVFQLKETKDAIKKTCKEKYGTEYASQSEEFKKICEKII